MSQARRRVATAIVPALLAAVLVPGVAQAATVTATSTVGDALFERVDYVAAPGETNDVKVITEGSYFVTGWLVNDATAPLTAGAGCVSLDAHTASCRVTDTEGNVVVHAALGDGNDYGSLADACPVNSTDYACHTLTIDAGSGNDVIRGADEFATDLTGGDGDDHLIAGKAGGVLDGGAGTDWLIGSGAAEKLLGGSGADRIQGYGGNDLARGGDGVDRVDGGAGRDTISGGRGRDQLNGGRDDDTFYAKDGQRDAIDGGSGRDRAGVDRGLDRTVSVERVHG